MKKQLTISIFLFLATTFLTAQPNRKALLVAVGNYPTNSGWGRINSLNDAVLTKQTLILQGFKEEDITLLADSAATKSGILKALDSLAKVVNLGDVAYFQFSGHGQQVADDNNDEPDGYDEAIVPFDSPMRYVSGVYEGENLIRDEELGASLRKIRRRLTASGNLCVVLDACHSGTGTRGLGIARGTTYVMADSTYKPTQMTGKKYEFGDWTTNGDGAASLAPMAAFFGSAQHQLNFETKDKDGKGIGSLTFALNQRLGQAEKGMTYRGLFDQIKMEMSAIAPRQEPQAEGLLDQVIFGGKRAAQTYYYKVKNYQDSSHLTLEVGWLQGIHEGSVVGFFPSETRSPEGQTPLATGVVTKSRPTIAEVELTGPLDPQVALGCWVFLLEKSFGKLQVAVDVQLPENDPLAVGLAAQFAKGYNFIAQKDAELFVLKSANDTVQLVTKDDFVLETIGPALRTEMAVHKIMERIKTYTQVKFLRGLEVTSFNVQSDFEIIPILEDSLFGEEIPLPLSEKQDDEGTLHLSVGNRFKIKVNNRSGKNIWVTLLDIQPDNGLNILFPEGNDTPDDYRIPAGESREIPITFIIGPPLGMELFKLVATDEPIDLRPVVAAKGLGLQPSTNPFEQLFGDTYLNEGTKGVSGKPFLVPMTSVHVFSMGFVID